MLRWIKFRKNQRQELAHKLSLTGESGTDSAHQNVYERIAEGNALADIEDSARRKWNRV